MHIAATNPSYLKREEVPTAELEHEQAVLAEQARNEGKPEKIIEKMVAGRIEKYYKEVCLMEQPFVKDPDKTISNQLLKSVRIFLFAVSPVINWAKALRKKKKTLQKKLCLS